MSEAGALAVLAEGMAALGLGEPEQHRRLAAYLRLLLRWNRVYNLVGTREAMALVRRHLLDCLAVQAQIDAGPVLDVGTGAGLPGIPLAICRPELGLVLVDSSAKKIRFLTQARITLGLDNVTLRRGRVQDLSGSPRFARIIARAFAPLPELADAALPLLAPDGRLLAMQGRVEAAALAALRARGLAVDAQPVRVPGLAEQRHLVSVAAAGPRAAVP